MTTDDPADRFDEFETSLASTDCRGCPRTVSKELPEIDGHADTWIRCAGCNTINRIKGTEMQPNEGETEA